MFLIDTNVISEIRKGPRADAGAIKFLHDSNDEIFIPVQVIGELRRGIENVLRRGDARQAKTLDRWLQKVLVDLARRILVFDLECAEMWGHLSGTNEQNPIDKQIAAIAHVYGLTMVTRNVAHFSGLKVPVLNPFSGTQASSL